MQGLRRTSDTGEASDSLAQLTISKRSVQLIGSGETEAADTAATAAAAAKAGRTGTGATRKAAVAARGAAAATSSLSGEADSTEQVGDRARDVFANASRRAGKSTARGTAKVVRGGAKVTGNAVKSGVVAAQKRAAAAKSTKAAADTTVTVGRGAAALTRAGVAAATAVKGVIAAVAAAVTSTPVMAIVSGVLVAVVAILSIISWLPGITSSQDREYGGGGDYPVGVAPGPWGDHRNGFIPEDLLSPIPWSTGYLLREDATASLSALNTAFIAEFGHQLTINDAYRDYAGQVEARNYWCGRGNCGNAAVPGTSNHGWALAVDLGGGISTFNTAEYNWMKANGPEYGWRHPDWAEPNGSQPEPWHWDFWGWAEAGGGDDTANPDENAGKDPGTMRTYAKTQLEAIFPSDAAAQYECLNDLWTNESSWNWRATNKSSGAYGIPQALPGDKMAAAGADWKTNPRTQIDWGLTYIQDRYNTPCQAWDTWLQNDPHWY